ncbi:MAG TPA: lysylphosphatidylglycerol synthase transmembrane domain-containing protein [Pyrinomonadaceae bacterium]
MRKYLKFAALCLLAALVLFWFGRNLNWNEVSEAIRRADVRLIAVACLFVCLTYFLRALRWRALLAPLAPETSLRELFAATTVGFGAVFLIGRAGEVVRPAFLPLREPRVRPSASFVTIAVERIYDMSAIVVLFAANLLVFRAPGGDAAAYARVRQAGLLLLIGAVAGIAALVWFRRRADVVVGWLEGLLTRAPRVVNRVGRIATGLLAQLARSLGVLTDARELLVTVGLTALLWGSIALANFLVMRAFGLGLGLSAAVFVMGWSLVGSLVPTPGGAAGTFHAATAAGLIFLGIARPEAAAISIILHLVVFAPALFFGLYYFLRSDVSLARLRHLMSTEDDDGVAAKPAGVATSEVA